MPGEWLQNVGNIQQHVKRETVTTAPDLSSQRESMVDAAGRQVRHSDWHFQGGDEPVGCWRDLADCCWRWRGLRRLLLLRPSVRAQGGLVAVAAAAAVRHPG